MPLLGSCNPDDRSEIPDHKCLNQNLAFDGYLIVFRKDVLRNEAKHAHIMLNLNVNKILVNRAN